MSNSHEIRIISIPQQGRPFLEWIYETIYISEMVWSAVDENFLYDVDLKSDVMDMSWQDSMFLHFKKRHQDSQTKMDIMISTLILLKSQKSIFFPIQDQVVIFITQRMYFSDDGETNIVSWLVRRYRVLLHFQGHCMQQSRVLVGLRDPDFLVVPRHFEW